MIGLSSLCKRVTYSLVILVIVMIITPRLLALQAKKVQENSGSLVTPMMTMMDVDYNSPITAFWMAFSVTYIQF